MKPVIKSKKRSKVAKLIVNKFEECKEALDDSALSDEAVYMIMAIAFVDSRYSSSTDRGEGIIRHHIFLLWMNFF